MSQAYDFAIFTDSSADLGEDLVREMDIQVLPLSFTIQDRTYHNYPDNHELDPHTFYKMLREGQTATTAAVNVEQYLQAMEPQLQAGRDVLVLAFSSGLSATYNSSAIAAEELREKYPERKIYTVDTLCASLGQGLLVWLAAKERAKGKTIDEALKLTNKAVVEALEGLPPIKVHCSVLAEQAVKAALSDYYRRQGIDPEPIVGKLEEDCDHCESCGH